MRKRRDLDEREARRVKGDKGNHQNASFPAAKAKQVSWSIELLNRPISASSLGTFRILFGSVMYIFADKVWNDQNQWSWDLRYQSQEVFLKYAWFHWLPEPGSVVFGLALPSCRALSYCMRISAVSLAVGILPRVSAAVYLVCFTFAFLAESSIYNNHYYFTILILMLFCITNSDKWASCHHLSNIVRGKAKTSVIPVWQLLVFQLQIFVVYFFGGFWKLSKEWLVRCLPIRLWLQTPGLMNLEKLEGLGIPGLAAFVRSQPYAPYFFSWSGALIDLLAPFLLFGWHPWKRIRWSLSILSMTICLTFHLLNSQLFNIGSFPFMMMASLVLTLPPDLPSRTLEMLFSCLGGNSGVGDMDAARKESLQRAPRFFLAAFVAFNVLWPLRHFVIEGPVETTLEGNQFAWRMKLHHRGGSALVRLRVQRDREKPMIVDRAVEDMEFLHKGQIQYCSTIPEYFQQCAIFFARKTARTMGLPLSQFQAFGSLKTYLNGRGPVPVVNSSIDLLTASSPLLGHASWVLITPAEYFWNYSMQI